MRTQADSSRTQTDLDHLTKIVTGPVEIVLKDKNRNGAR